MEHGLKIRRAVLRWGKWFRGRVSRGVERCGDKALQWCADRIGLAFALALGLFLLVVAVCGALWHWAGWDRETDLAVAEVLTPLAFAGFGLVVVSAAVRAFRPLRPVLAFSAQPFSVEQPHAPPGTLVFTIENLGRVPASDVSIAVVADSARPPELVGPSWSVSADGAPLPPVLSPDWSRTIFRRLGSLPPSSKEIIFLGFHDNILGVHITASNADEVDYFPQATSSS